MQKLQLTIIGIVVCLTTLIWVGYTLATCDPDDGNCHARASVTIVGFAQYKATADAWCTGGVTSDGQFWQSVRVEYTDTSQGTFTGSASPPTLSQIAIAGSAEAHSSISGYANGEFWCAADSDYES